MVIITKWQCPKCKGPMEEMKVRDHGEGETTERLHCSKCFGLWVKPEGSVL